MGVGWGAGGAGEEVLVEVGDAAADDRGEDGFGGEFGAQGGGGAVCCAADGSGLVVGEVGEGGCVAACFDEEVAGAGCGLVPRDGG